MLNRASRKLEIQPDLARKVVGGRARPDDDPRRLRRARGGGQHRLAGAHGGRASCARAFEALADELDALPGAGDEPRADRAEPRGLLARLGGERGQSTAEVMGLLPVLARGLARALADRR